MKKKTFESENMKSFFFLLEHRHDQLKKYIFPQISIKVGPMINKFKTVPPPIKQSLRNIIFVNYLITYIRLKFYLIIKSSTNYLDIFTFQYPTKTCT